MFVLAVAVMGCGGGGDGGGGSDEAGEAGEAGDTLPADAMVGSFVAGDDEAWLTVRDGASEARVWELRPDGLVPTDVELTPHAMSLAAVAGGVAIGNLRCEDGSPAGRPGCDRSVGVVTILGDDGAVRHEVEVWSRDGAAGGSDGIAIDAASRDTLWVGTSTGSLEVSATDGAVRRMPDPPRGLRCSIGDELYVVVGSSAAELSARRWDGQAWAHVPGTATAPPRPPEPADPSSPVTASPGPAVPPGPGDHTSSGSFVLECAVDRVDAVLPGNRARLVGSWAPGQGFVPAAAPGDPPPWRPTHLSERQGAFSLDAEGRVLERNDQGTYVPAGVTLPGVDPAIPVPRFVAAASSTLLAACAQPRDDVPYSCRSILRR